MYNSQSSRREFVGRSATMMGGLVAAIEGGIGVLLKSTDLSQQFLRTLDEYRRIFPLEPNTYAVVAYAEDKDKVKPLIKIPVEGTTEMSIVIPHSKRLTVPRDPKPKEVPLVLSIEQVIRVDARSISFDWLESIEDTDIDGKANIYSIYRSDKFGVYAKDAEVTDRKFPDSRGWDPFLHLYVERLPENIRKYIQQRYEWGLGVLIREMKKEIKEAQSRSNR